MLTRKGATDLACEELRCLSSHVANLQAICGEAALAEWGPGIEQLRAAVDRIGADISATRTAKLQ